MLDEFGARRLELDLGIPRRTLIWLAAGQPVLESTVTHVRTRIRECREDWAQFAAEDAAKAAARRGLRVIGGGRQSDAATQDGDTGGAA